jgi:hypothetical protein
MEVLLGSETLQLRSENAYYFLCAWLLQTPRLSDEDESRALYKQLLPLLRFQHMSLDFLGTVVSACPYANAPGLLSYIFRCSTTLRTTPRAFAKRKGVNVGSKDRGRGDLLCTFKSKLELADLLPMKSETRTHKHLGLALGFLVGVSVRHTANGTMGVYVFAKMPFWEGFDIEGGIERGAGFEYSMKLGNDKACNGRKHFSHWGSMSWGRHDYFDNPWAEVVCPDSPYFPGGVLEVELTLKPLTQD